MSWCVELWWCLYWANCCPECQNVQSSSLSQPCHHACFSLPTSVIMALKSPTPMQFKTTSQVIQAQSTTPTASRIVTSGSLSCGSSIYWNPVHVYTQDSMCHWGGHTKLSGIYTHLHAQTTCTCTTVLFAPDWSISLFHALYRWSRDYQKARLNLCHINLMYPCFQQSLCSPHFFRPPISTSQLPIRSLNY